MNRQVQKGGRLRTMQYDHDCRRQVGQTVLSAGSLVGPRRTRLNQDATLFRLKQVWAKSQE